MMDTAASTAPPGSPADSAPKSPASQEIALKEREIAIKAREVNLTARFQALSFVSAVLGACLAFFGTSYGNWKQADANRQLESDKAQENQRLQTLKLSNDLQLERQKLEGNVILTLLADKDAAARKENLLFLNRAKYIHLPDDLAKDIESDALFVPQVNPSAENTYCPGVQVITACSDEGCGPNLDSALNKRKNIRSEKQEPTLRTIGWIKGLPNPTHFTKENRNRDELMQLGEGEKITVVAFALVARRGSQESCNCMLTSEKDTDNHIVLVDPTLKNPTLAANETDSVTVEFTPRVRLDHPNFTRQKLNLLIDPNANDSGTPKGKLLVRVTGLLMFDSEHFLGRALKRHNNWEIHPVLKMEYCPEGKTCQAESDANWQNLEDA